MKTHSIRWKIIGWLSFSLFFVGSLIFYTHYRDMLAHEMDVLEYHINTMNRVILAALEHSMIKMDTDYIQKISEKIGNTPEIIRLWILNKDGVVKVASKRNEIGLKIDRNDPMCVTCHGKTLKTKPVNLVIKEGPEKLYRKVLPIYNKNECHKCHNPSKATIGMMLVDHSIKESDRVLGLYIKRYIYHSLFALIVIGFVAYILIEILIRRRLDALKKGAILLEKGELETSVKMKGRDEIKELADTFNSMANEIRERIEELERFRKATIKRELRIKELRDEIQDLRLKIQELEKE